MFHSRKYYTTIFFTIVSEETRGSIFSDENKVLLILIKVTISLTFNKNQVLHLYINDYERIFFKLLFIRIYNSI